MKMTKRLFVTIIMCVMLCGVTVVASTNDAPTHTHAFSAQEYVLYNSYTISTHSYVSGWDVDANGDTVPVYGECHVVMFRYRAIKKCGCGATNGYDYYDDVQHMQCGE